MKIIAVLLETEICFMSVITLQVSMVRRSSTEIHRAKIVASGLGVFIIFKRITWLDRNPVTWERGGNY